jgi:hypothetical protein
VDSKGLDSAPGSFWFYGFLILCNGRGLIFLYCMRIWFMGFDCFVK